MKRVAFLFCFVCAVLLVADETHEFQYGVKPEADYIKYGDTFTTALDPDTTYGSYKHLTVSGYDKPSRIFIEFGIKELVAAGSTVKSAKLYLYPKVYKTVPNKVKCYMVKANWEGRAATWNVATPGVRWESKGGSIDEALSSGTLKVVDGYHVWDVTEIVQNWTNYPNRNFGFMLKFEDEKVKNEVWYYSAETKLTEYRPRLVITSITQEALKKEAEDAKKKEAEEKEKRIQKILEGGGAKEEGGKAAAADKDAVVQKALKKLGNAYQVVKLELTPYRSYRRARPLPDWFGHKIRFTSQAPGVLGDLRNDKASASVKGKFGKAYYARWVTHVTKESTSLVVRVRSKVSFSIDLDKDNTYDPRKETFKLDKDHAGPILLKDVVADRLKVAYKYDYYAYIVKNIYRPRQEYENDSNLFILRHAGYLAGKLGDKEVKVFDENNDFKFDTSGQDVISIGGEEQPLNTYITLDGQLHKVSMSAGGLYVALAPVSKLKGAPAMCSFDAFKEFNRGRTGLVPEYIRINSVTRDKPGLYMATRRNPVISVPQGSYQIFFASMKSSKSKEPYIIDGGSMPAFNLTADQYNLKWGGPLKLTFMANRMGEEYKIGVNNIKITDASGAELRFPQGEKRFISAPKVEFYPGNSTRKETARMFTLRENSSQLSDLTVKVKKSGTYKMIMIAKTKAFGELEGELSR